MGAAVDAPVVSIVAPAGYGKTSLAIDLVTRRRRIPVAWYSVGEGDDSLPRFWGYVFAAIRGVSEEAFGELAEITPQSSFAEFQPLLDSVIAAMGTLERPFSLVLEDVHVAMGSEDVRRSIAYLVRNLPPSVRLVLVSRSELDLPLARARIAGGAREFSQEDLTFDGEDVRELFGSVGARISRRRADELARRMGGWPVGLTAAALALGDSTSGSASRADAGVEAALEAVRGDVYDYLAQEVLDSLGPDLCRFLCLTSAVDGYCASLASAMTGVSEADAQRMADSVVAGGLFTQSLEVSGRSSRGGEEWFRYHPLFGDLLRARFDRLPEGSRREALIRARDWYARRGYLDEAVRLSARLEDYDAVRSAIIDNWKALYAADAQGRLLAWGELIPPGEVERYPYLSAVLAVPYALAGDFARASSLVTGAMLRLHDDHDYLFALCMLQKAIIASLRGDHARTRDYAERALLYLPDDQLYLRAVARQTYAGSFGLTDPARAVDILREAELDEVELGDRNVLCSLWGNLAMTLAIMGRLTLAEGYAHRALDLYERGQRAYKPMLGYAWLSLAICDYERGDAASCLEVLDGHLADPKDGAAPYGVLLGTLRAKARLALGDARGLEVAAGACPTVPRDASQLYLVACGYPTLDMTRALPRDVLSRAVASLSRGEPAGPMVAVLAAQAAFVTNAVDAYDEVAALADASDGELPAVTGRLLVTAAAFDELTAHLDASVAHLERAALLARECGMPQFLVENAARLAPALRYEQSHARDGRAASFLRETLAPLATDGVTPAGNGNPRGARDLGISDREFEAIGLAAEGLTVAQVGEAMFVSSETAKKHLSNLYAKLGVHSKLQAVAKLRELGIL